MRERCPRCLPGCVPGGLTLGGASLARGLHQALTQEGSVEGALLNARSPQVAVLSPLPPRESRWVKEVATQVTPQDVGRAGP